LQLTVAASPGLVRFVTRRDPTNRVLRMRSGGDRPKAGMAVSVAVVLFAVTGVIMMITGSGNLGHTLIGGSVVGGVALCVFWPKRTT
jgi:hypothetical protein